MNQSSPGTGLYNAAADLLGRNLEAGRGERIAVIDGAGPTTYAELDARANRFANALAGLGLEMEQRVVLCLHDTVDFPACFLGAIKAGVVPVPVNTRLTERDYDFILGDSRARALVVSENLLGAFAPHLDDHPLLDHVIVSGGDGGGHARLADLTDGAAETFQVAPTKADDMCFWLYTSGTTGMPKGAVHLHGHLLRTADLYAIPTLGLSEDDVVFSAAKLFFAYGLGNAMTFPFAVGATAVLLEGPPMPDAIIGILKAHKPTVFYGVPTLFAMLLANDALPAAGDHALRLCVSAGEALPGDLLARWRDAVGTDILDGLGSTEMLHIFLTNRQGDVRPNCSGKPVPGYELRIVDDAGRPVAEGELGNLHVAGPTSAIMYWNQRDKSRETFLGPWTVTGDKYSVDTEGYYIYGGRSDDMLKVGGIYVSPFEVEGALIEHAAVLEAAVVGHPDSDDLIKPKAFVVLQDGQEGTEALADELRQFVRDSLADYKYPRWIEFVDELPKTATGKIQRFKLRQAG
ncbi:MAG: benzoate-CoA ligase family protein [Magnetovibrio sp.]|nr:benzoate-CoA ligase family protein [Magnetovibrio sp.]